MARGLRILEVPLDMPPLVEAFCWHPGHDRDPEHQRLRSRIVHATEITGTASQPHVGA